MEEIAEMTVSKLIVMLFGNPYATLTLTEKLELSSISQYMEFTKWAIGGLRHTCQNEPIALAVMTLSHLNTHSHNASTQVMM